MSSQHQPQGAAMDFEAFDRLARSRRATRHFKKEPIPEGLLERVLDTTRWAPSGYNIQPTHFVLSTEADSRYALYKACLEQPQVLEAPAVVVFTGDRRAVENNLEAMLTLELAEGACDDRYATMCRKFVGLAFNQGPLGIGWLGKLLVAPLMRLSKPTPSIPAVHKRYWLCKQVMLGAMTFMLAAEAAGLATIPMEGFDEGRVRKALGIPRSHIVPVVIPVGYAESQNLKKTRLPLAGMMHKEGW
ncbi:hypothetical protein ABI59_00355 [Acidobacteria bacterium Mor1]|nr:hypothetical protein ABI59_00355 [Acidobacteria bacterium Mor1]